MKTIEFIKIVMCLIFSCIINFIPFRRRHTIVIGLNALVTASANVGLMKKLVLRILINIFSRNILSLNTNMSLILKYGKFSIEI